MEHAEYIGMDDVIKYISMYNDRLNQRIKNYHQIKSNMNCIEVDTKLYKYCNNIECESNTAVLSSIHNTGIRDGLFYSTKQIKNYLDQDVTFTTCQNKIYVTQDGTVTDLRLIQQEAYTRPFNKYISDIKVLDEQVTNSSDALYCCFIGDRTNGNMLLDKLDSRESLYCFIFNDLTIHDKCVGRIKQKFDNYVTFKSKQYGNDIVPSMQAIHYMLKYNFKFVYKLHTKSNLELFHKAVDYIINTPMSTLEHGMKVMRCHCVGHPQLTIKLENDTFNNKLVELYNNYIDKTKSFIAASIFFCTRQLMENTIEFMRHNNYRSYFLNNMYDSNLVNYDNSPVHFLERLFGCLTSVNNNVNTHHYNSINIICIKQINCSIADNAMMLKSYFNNKGTEVNLIDVRLLTKGEKANHVFEHDNNIFAVQPFEIDVNMMKRFKSKPSAFWVWEFKSLPLKFKKMEKYFNKVLTISDFCCNVFKNNISLPIEKIELKSQIHDNVKYLSAHKLQNTQTKEVLKQTENKIRYGYCYDLNSSIIRKNVLNLVKSFKILESTDINKVLILKSRALRCPAHKYELECIAETYALIENSSNIYIINDQLSMLDLYKLYTCLDFYVSPHCGEGYGLTIYDNYILGNIIICPYYSGETDYLDREKIIELKYEEKEMKALKEHPIYGQMTDFISAYVSKESILDAIRNTPREKDVLKKGNFIESPCVETEIKELKERSAYKLMDDLTGDQASHEKKKEALDKNEGKYNETTPIDIILLWVNMNDDNWKQQYAKYNDISKISKQRYEEHDELELSLFTINKYMPWIRNIFIITECELLPYTNKYKNIKKIHQDLILNNTPAITPNFNSNVIESLFYKIPNLSEIFLFACDDFFVGKHISKQYWFNNSWTKPKCHLRGIQFNRPIKSYWHYMNNSNKLTRSYFNTNYDIDIVPTHQISLLTKQSCEKGWNLFESSLIELCKTRTRSPNEVQITTHLLFQLVGMNLGLIDIEIDQEEEFNKNHPFGTKHYDGCIQKGNDYSLFLKNILIEQPNFYCINHLYKAKKGEFKIFKEIMMKSYTTNDERIKHIHTLFNIVNPDIFRALGIG